MHKPPPASITRLTRTFTLLLVFPVILIGNSYVMRDDSPLYTEFLDPDFPFLEATIDLRGIAPAGNNDNLVPRALVIPLEHDIFVCFDTELLRVAAIWQGDFITPQGIAILSYPVPLRKMGGGQEQLPQPVGKIIAATGLYPGWHLRGTAKFTDPRPRWVDPDELGRGPLSPEHGRWLGVHDIGAAAVLHYSLFDGEVQEHFRVEEDHAGLTVVRSIEIDGTSTALDLVANDKGREGGLERYELVAIEQSDEARRLAVAYPLDSDIDQERGFEAFEFERSRKPSRHWPDPITTGYDLGNPHGSYAVDHLQLPYPNPWERRIRPTAIDFFPNGDAVIVTIDGDVYRLRGLGKSDDSVQWSKIAAGFHEPQSITIRDKDVFVFSRLGITKLVDIDGDGETDIYRMFCNRFTQSADTRDFPLSMVLRNDGSFVISKGGQQESAFSPHSGRALHISADGTAVGFWAFGMRNGYLNTIPERDLIVASDQQGNWVPTTPFLVVEEGSYHGYEPGGAEQALPTKPAPLWLPHRISQSGIDPIWGSDPRLGALHKSILYTDYTRPAVIRISIPDNEEFTQTYGVPLDLPIELPLLKGDINPTDGLPYMVGFQIWSSVARRLEGICRLRVINPTDDHPTHAEVFREGVLISFSNELNPEVATDPANFLASSWNYARTDAYGSAQYKADGTPGADERFIHSVLLSEDKRSVFIVIESMETTMQLEIQHQLFGKWVPVYFTVHELPDAALDALGFGSVDFEKLFSAEPTPRDVSTQQAVVSETRGQELAAKYGCIGCHSIDGTTEGRIGPSWFGIYHRWRVLKDGTRVRAHEEYLRNAILDPGSVVVEGYEDAEAGMPSYRGILSDDEIDSIVMFIRSLR